MSAYAIGASSSAARVGRERRRSSNPHAASVKVPNAPVREPLSTTTKSSGNAISPAAERRNTFASPSQIAATIDQSKRLLKWLGWRRLPTARPSIALCAIQLPSIHPGA